MYTSALRCRFAGRADAPVSRRTVRSVSVPPFFCSYWRSQSEITSDGPTEKACNVPRCKCSFMVISAVYHSIYSPIGSRQSRRQKKHQTIREDPMKTKYKIAIALVAGASIGGAAIQGLHAQAKPPTYIVIPILKINDPAAFKAGVVDKALPADLTAAGGHYVVRSQKFTSLDGNPPERLVILSFDSAEKAQAFWNTSIQKEVNSARVKSTNSLAFMVDGFAN